MRHLSESLLLVLAAALTLLTGCIKGEEPNIEVDVLAVTARCDGVLNVVFQPGALGHIDVYADPSRVDRSDITLDFTLSAGATISPDPATVSDYTAARTFTVTSQDGCWRKDYAVRVLFTDLPTDYGFECWEQPARMKYMIPYELDPSGERMYIWACGNPAFNFIAGHNDDHTVFPTYPDEDAVAGRWCAHLVTRNTPELTKPIASGSLFIGQFDASLRDPRESTQFGLPFMRKPLRLRGRYRYRSGGNTLMTNEPDMGRIQAVLFRTDASTPYLTGYTIKNSPNVIARAELTATDTPGQGYAAFDLEMVYTAPIDPQVMARGGYSLTIVFSSSRNGDNYDGAAGSSMWVDDVHLICETTDEEE